MRETIPLEEYKMLSGLEYGVSRWYCIDQDRIDRFADVSDDHQAIHVDPLRAAETPFGTTIAHGFLTLAMLTAMANDLPKVEGVEMGVNFGFNKVRFLHPVPAGARIRGRFKIKDVTEKKPGEFTTVFRVTVEIEDTLKPVLTAEWIGRSYIGRKPL